MKFKKLTLAVMVSSAFVLTGCLDDTYDYGNDSGGQGGGGGTDNKLSWGVHLYMSDKPDHYKETPYVIEVEDSTGDSQAFDGNLIDLANISIESDDFANFSPMTVKISEEQAKLKFVADKGYDLDTTYNGNGSEEHQKRGVLRFMLKPEAPVSISPNTPVSALLTMSDGSNTASVDISSSVAALKGSEAQRITVPLHCFEDAGINLASVETAMSLDIDGAINYEVSDVLMTANALPPAWAVQDIQACTNNSHVESADRSVLRSMLKGNDAEGWATRLMSNNGSLGYGQPGGWDSNLPQFAEIIATGDNYKPANKTFFPHLVSLEDIPTVDLAQYIETGALEFLLFMSGAGTEPGHENYEIQFKFDATTPEGSEGGIESASVGIDMSDETKGATVWKISIPMRDLFAKTDNNGVDIGVRLNTAQNINKLTSWAVSMNPDDGHNFEGFRYGLADIAIVKEPTQNELKTVYTPPAP
ncbi:putative glycoside hydrolase [Vibrio cionasavignyae]|uniref:putative glycoside hydrolase n=1 Tax=Vibrio cionasavignyae TaxID=2910252 RepID=UPI003D0FA86E